MSLTSEQDNLANLRTQRSDIEAMLRHLNEQVQMLELEIEEKKRLGDDGAVDTLEQEITAVQEEITNNSTSLLQTKEDEQIALDELMGSVSGANPIAHFDDKFPILLYPVRVEARFMEGSAAHSPSELWVRIFPDDIHIDTHEEDLSIEEINAAEKFWEQYYEVAGNTESELGVWRALVTLLGDKRAAYVKEAHQPTSTSPLTFPNVTYPHLDSWTRPPMAKGLPDYFVVTGYNGGVKDVEQQGNLIPDPLIVGMDPQQGAGFEEDANGNMVFEEDMLWMVDFTKAMEIGMAVKLPLTLAQSTSGFELLTVLGVRISASPTKSQEHVECLLKNHQYTSGLKMIPQGTPTNNSESGTSGGSADDDEATASFDLELGGATISYTPGQEPALKTDGQWMAEMLGLDYGVFDHIENSTRREAGEALDMNAVLWPATFGYYLEQMARTIGGGLMSEQTRDEIRDIFSTSITARGMLPTLRIDDQPYGILPVTAQSSLVLENQTEELIWTRAKTAQAVYQSKVPDVKVAANSNAGNWQESLMNMMGLQPNSAEFYQRFAGGPNFNWNMMFYTNTPDRENWYMSMMNNANTTATNDFDLSYTPFLFSLSHLSGQVPITGPLVDLAPLSESEGIHYPVNYFDWLLNVDLIDIKVEDFGGGEVPNSLLYLLARRAFLLENYDAIVRALIKFDPTNPNPVDRVEKELINFDKAMGQLSDETRWDVLFCRDIEGGPTSQFLSDPANWAQYINEMRYLFASRTAMERLQNLPTARLERLMVENIDLGTYRMDSWITGVVTRRLADQRIQGASRTKGIQYGGYGWLENLKPTNYPRTLATETPDGLEDPSTSEPLIKQANNFGFVMGPSMNHALTGAVLRNTYVENEGATMAVNLNSWRVRKAKQLIEGIANGQPLPALLGYQFQRALHEGYPTLEMDLDLLQIRKKFPLTTGGVTDTDVGSQSNEDGSESQEARNVVDGLKLVEKYNENGDLSALNLSGIGTQELAAIDTEIKKLIELIDALGDLTTAEGVFHAMQGNHDKAGALLQALGEGKHIPDDMEMVNTPRSGNTVTHRTGVVFEAENHNNWSDEGTSRSISEPGLNYWLYLQLSEASMYMLHYETYQPDSTKVDESGFMTLDQLGIEPIDLLYMMQEEEGSDETIFSSYVAYMIRSIKNVPDVNTVKLQFKMRDESLGLVYKTFGEVSPLISVLIKLVNGGQALDAKDFLYPHDEPEDLSNPGKVDIADLSNRLQNTYDRMIVLLDDVNFEKDTTGLLTISDPPQASDRAVLNALRNKLATASLWGINEAVPVSGYDASDASQASLVIQADSVVAEIENRILEVTGLFPGLSSGSIPGNSKAEDLSEAFKTMLGRSFKVMPKFTPWNLAEIGKAFDARVDILPPDEVRVMDSWVQSNAKVRKAMSEFEFASMLQTVLVFDQYLEPGVNRNWDLEPMQLPYTPDDFWVGSTIPDTKTIEQDKLSLVMKLPENLNEFGAMAGLRFDEWSEKIPYKEETVGLAFNYEEPKSEAPQTLLLVTTPVVTGEWEWADLEKALLETLQFAKERAVEPALFSDMSLAQTVPTTMAPIASDDEATIALNFNRVNS